MSDLKVLRLVKKSEGEPRFWPASDVEWDLLVERIGRPRVVTHGVDIGQAIALTGTV